MPSEFVKEVADVFAKDGPLSKVTANYTPRPSQIEFAGPTRNINKKIE